jgi:Oxidoreductase FAD-binding domain
VLSRYPRPVHAAFVIRNSEANHNVGVNSASIRRLHRQRRALVSFSHCQLPSLQQGHFTLIRPAPQSRSPQSQNQPSQAPMNGWTSRSKAPPASRQSNPLCKPGDYSERHADTGAQLAKVTNVNHNTKMFTFELPDKDSTLGLVVNSCILTMYKGPMAEKPTVRPYTPISAVDQKVQSVIFPPTQLPLLCGRCRC